MTPQEEQNSSLLALIVQGDEAAFGRVYKMYVRELYSYARKSISVKEDCEEIVQDVFESLWVRREQLSHVTALKPYLFGMVKYKVIRYLQHSVVKLKYREHYKIFEAVYNNIEEFDTEPSLVQSIIEKGLAGLPERCRVAMRLRLNENLSNDDIAKRMNIKKTVVENYMVTALRHLRTSQRDLFKAGS